MGRTQDKSGLLGWAALAAVAALGVSLAAYRSNEVDLFWHLKAGEWIVAHQAVPRVDMFSFAREGEQWIDAQWLFQVALYGSWRLWGQAGPAVLRMTGIALALVFLMLAAPRGLGLTLRAACGLLFLAAVDARVMCRPELLTFICMAAELWCLERMRAGRLKFLVPLALAQVAFANVEGLWPIGIAMALAYLLDAAEGLKGRGRAAARELGPWIAATAAVTAASLVQAYGLAGVMFPLTLLKEVAAAGTEQKQLVQEFHPIFHGPWSPWLFVPFVGLSTLAGVSGLLCGRRMRPGLWLLGLVFTYLAVMAVRNTGVAAVFLTQVLTAHLDILGKKWVRLRSEPVRRIAGALTVGLALLLVFLTLAPAKRFWDHTWRRPGLGIALDGKYYPVETAEYLKSIGYKGNLINGMDVGGYLIWAGWPQWKVMADNRFELGGEEAIRYYKNVYTNLDTLARVSAEHDASAVVMSFRQPYSEPFLALLKDRRWALVHLDYTGGVFLRRGPRWDAVIARDEVHDPLRREFSPYGGPPPWVTSPGASGSRP